MVSRCLLISLASKPPRQFFSVLLMMQSAVCSSIHSVRVRPGMTLGHCMVISVSGSTCSAVVMLLHLNHLEQVLRNDGGKGFFLGDKVCVCVRESLPCLHESYPLFPLSPLSQQFVLHGTPVSNPLLTVWFPWNLAVLIVIAVDLCGHCCVPSTEGNRVPVSGSLDIPLLHGFKQRMQQRPRIKTFLESECSQKFCGNSMM